MKERFAVSSRPDLASLVARLAAHHGLTNVVNAGAWWPLELAPPYPNLRVFTGGSRGLSRVDPTRTAIVLDAVRISAEDLEQRLDALGRLVDQVPVMVVATDEIDLLRTTLTRRGIEPFLVGQTRATSGPGEERVSVVIVDRIMSLPVPAPPDDFRVVAIMTVYNEEDVLAPSLTKLIGDGVGVYVVDNWSSDDSFEIARSFVGRGLVGLERFPATSQRTFQLQPLMERVEEIAAEERADWCIHHDVDERRSGPWAGVGLRESIWKVQSFGFSAIDHTVLNFRPVNNGFKPGNDFEAYFRYFEFGRTRDLLVQTKAWRNMGRVQLASSGGHEARFVGRRVFPYKFLLKHYPVRSQTHGELKIFRNRIARWDPAERARGWHDHYDKIAERQSFLREPADLIEDRGAETRATYLAEIVAGAGLADLLFPSWAQRNRGSRALYRQARRLLGGDNYERLRRSPLLRPGFVRRPLARLRSIILEGRSSPRPG